MRVVAYARYSSDLQSASSIDDQLELCRRYAAGQGWEIGATYADAAMSGASKFRPGYQRMLVDAEARRFDVLVVEAVDRLGRKLSDIADLHDRLLFARIRLFAVNTGEVTTLHIGLLGTMSQMFLADLRDKTRRGQLGRVRDGRIPAGKAYGYDLVPGSEGERTINQPEAAVIRRIFESFVEGESPRAMAKQLNEEHVPGPDGRPWGDTTIRGQPERGTGILNNSLYAGRLEWNRCSYVKDPSTGRRVARPNPRDRWEITPVPELRIVPDELWERVKVRQADLSFEVTRSDTANRLNSAHRHRFLLSGLLTCGCCGGPYIIYAPDRFGCSVRRAKGTCDNAVTVTRQEIEGRVLGGLKGPLLTPELVAGFADEFRRTVEDATREAMAEHTAIRSDLDKTDRAIAGYMKAIEDGLYTPAIKGKMQALEQRRQELGARLDLTAAPPAIPP